MSASRPHGRHRLALVAVLTVIVASGCSIREVTLWFQVRGATISEGQAEEIAAKVNAKRPAGGCDANYAGECVPDNQARVHCKGTPGGVGPAIQGPLLVVGWDSFGLDPDGDKVACNTRSPIGSLDVSYQKGIGLVVSGWALDPDGPTTAVDVHIYDNGAGHAAPANVERADLAPLGYGTAHGYSSAWSATPGLHEVCVYGINGSAGGSNTLVGCETVAVEPAMIVDWGTRETVGLLERAEFTKVGGQWRLHVAGFAYDVDTNGLPAGLHIAQVGHPYGSYIMNTPAPITQRLSRPDVLDIDPNAPTDSGFDFTVDTNYTSSIPEAICLVEYAAHPDFEEISCREIVVRP